MPYPAIYWIEKLKLIKHPEGGYFREVYRSPEVILKKGLPQRYTSFRTFSTSIYYLLESHEFSTFHRLKSDETWHYYTGSPIVLYILPPSGDLKRITLGPESEQGENFQYTVGKGCWFAAAVVQAGSYTLVGCTVAPAFDTDDFELGSRSKLSRLFPRHKLLISQFTLMD